MADNQISRMDVQFAPFPSGFCPATLNDFGTQLAKNLIVTPGLGFSGINIGPTAPQNTSLPWFNTTMNDWFYWSTVAGDWLPVRPETITGEVQVGTVIGWDGQVSLVDAFWGSRWLFANGDAISRTLYPDYFGLVGTKWGPGDGLTTFNIIDMRDYFWVGANQDSAGEAKTIVSDGVTLTTQRSYQSHKHAREALDNTPGAGQGIPASGVPYSTTELSTASDNVSEIPIRVLPPYKALVPIVRVK